MQSALNYTIVVTGPAYGTQQATLAYQTSQAILATGHQIGLIFFYQDGVYNANRFISPANDDFNLLQAWQLLAKQWQLSLEICHSAAARRGITADNLADGFHLSSLTALSEALLTSDRVLQF